MDNETRIQILMQEGIPEEWARLALSGPVSGFIQDLTEEQLLAYARAWTLDHANWAD